jgi:hypothetical protein
MTLTTAFKILAVFVPELTAQIPAIIAAIATLQKAQIIVQPAVTRFEAGENGTLELIGEAGQLTAMGPDIVAALKTIEQVQAIFTAYGAKIEGATQ